MDTAMTTTNRDDISEGMSFSDLVGMGTALVATGFLPAHIKNGNQFAAIVLAGRELGMPPMRSLRSLHLVKGKVVEDAGSQLARFKTSGGRAKWTHLDATRAELWLRHPNGDEHTETFTIEDARGAELLNDIHPQWKHHPKAMLRSRAITAGLKSIGWEGGVGAYDPDEARSFSDDTPAAQAPAPRAVVDVPHVDVPPLPPPVDVPPQVSAPLAEREKWWVARALAVETPTEFAALRQAFQRAGDRELSVAVARTEGGVIIHGADDQVEMTDGPVVVAMRAAKSRVAAAETEHP